ncbi:MAG: ADP-ribosylglycohydrolase family protein [Lyngbya sp.]|nr:ADP-ribosylglycohydrolase family protein [Lyngbya sp.]
MGKIASALIGLCVGDALGVPVEFHVRSERRLHPVTTMIGYGTYNQPPGTWSDDSSLTLCLADVLCHQGYDLNAIADSFCRWYRERFWTARGGVFDIGVTTQIAINRLRKGVPPVEAGETSDRSNGNGSLMRILPLAFLYKQESFPDLIAKVHDCSKITHAHARSQMACGIYISIAISLLQGMTLKEAYLSGIERIKPLYETEEFADQLRYFKRVLPGDIETVESKKIESSGYVLHTLEASLWCLLTTSSYSEAVLKAVNLGDDSDTTGAVTGGLAGIYYGLENIPSEWVEVLARKDDILNLAEQLEQRYFV